MVEIGFAINPQATTTTGCLVLDLVEVVHEGYALSLKPVQELRRSTEWQSLARLPTDREVLSFLIKEEWAYQQKATGKTPHKESFLFNQVHVSPLQTKKAIESLAPTQKLFCAGKQLTVDLYGTAEFFYEGSLLGVQLEIQGKLSWRDTVISLKDCPVIIPGKPHWFVHGILLKMIGTSISWKQLKDLHQEPHVLEGSAKHTFLDALDPEDSDAPKLMLKEGSLDELSQGASPFPILLLKDRWGACADLWMDYGHGTTNSRA